MQLDGLYILSLISDTKKIYRLNRKVCLRVYFFIIAILHLENANAFFFNGALHIFLM